MRLDDLICHPGLQDISYAFIWIITTRILMKEVKLRIFFVTLIFSHHLLFHRIVSSDYANQYTMSYLPGQHCISFPSIWYSHRHCPLTGTMLTLNTWMSVPQDVVQLRMLSHVCFHVSVKAPEWQTLDLIKHQEVNDRKGLTYSFLLQRKKERLAGKEKHFPSYCKEDIFKSWNGYSECVES